MIRQRWVWANEQTALLVSNYIDKFIIDGPLPFSCCWFKTRTCQQHTISNEAAIPIFRDSKLAQMYVERINPENRLSLQQQPLDEFLTLRKLSAMVLVLDFDPVQKKGQDCTVIRLSDVEFPDNFTVSNLY
jgi:hypothetical protein